MTHTRITPVGGLRRDEIVRLDDRIVKVERVTEGALTYRGRTFDVTYVTGRSAEGRVELVIPSDRILIAGH
jgi:hypothetical protein